MILFEFLLPIFFAQIVVTQASGVLGDEDYGSFREYGKNGVKVLYLNDQNKYHQISEITVKTRIMLNNDDEYRDISNAGVIATDTQKNIIYILAKKHGIAEPEIFGQILANFFLDEYPHVIRAKIEIVVTPWARSLDAFGQVHTHGFVAQGQERTAKIIKHKGQPAQVSGGVSGLRILKTTMSSHNDFLKDIYTTLSDADDRMLSTVVKASWKLFNTGIVYDGAVYNAIYNSAIRGIMDEFFGPAEEGRQSTIIQETNRRAEANILRNNPLVESVEMEFPNKHYFDVDFSKFPEVQGLNETDHHRVYIAGTVPFGVIHTTLHRNDLF